MAILCLVKDYSNYYNRIIKNPSSYKDLIEYDKEILNPVNFDKNDFVDTTQVINWDKDWQPNYLVELAQKPRDYVPSILNNGLENFQIKNTSGVVFTAENVDEIITEGFYDSETKVLNLSKIGNYHNDNYGLVELSIQGDWDYDKFSIRLLTPNGVTVNVWSDTNDITFTAYDEIVDMSFLNNLGWQNNEAVLGIKISAASPDTFYGQALCKDYNTNATILSRWFVIECDKIRNNQYRLILRRDLVSDDMTSVRNSISSIERCNLKDTDVLIYNKEPFQFNQVKTKEVAIYDSTCCPWIVGYMPSGQVLSGSFSVARNYDVDKSDMAHNEWSYAGQATGPNAIKAFPTIIDTDVTISYTRDWWVGGYAGGQAHQSRTSSAFTNSVEMPDNPFFIEPAQSIGLLYETIRYSESTFKVVRDANRSTWIDWSTADSRLRTVLAGTIINDSDYYELSSLNGKKILFSDGIYQVSFTSNGSENYTKTRVDDTVTDYIVDCFQARYKGSVKNDGKMSYKYRLNSYNFYLTKVGTADTIHWSFASTNNNLTDAPYKMFAIPYPKATADALQVTTDSAECDRDIILKTVQNIIKSSTTGTGSDNLYDIQILPYCPVEFKSYLMSSGNMNLVFQDDWTENIDYSKVKKNQGESSESVAFHIFFPKESTFKFNINKGMMNGQFNSLDNIFRITDKKIQNETEMARICSPNYASIFEMSPAKNNGIKAINVSCTYKPYNPFILVAPEFDGLYGRDFSDNRGLLLAGDFSLPIINSAWVSFELQNKTYQQSFNREVVHMDKEFDIQRQEAIWKFAGNTVSSGVNGGIAGGMAGGVYGAIAGAVVGTVAGMAGGAADYSNLKKRQSEEINYKKDMFNFGLQNIKALPNSLNKTSSINANSKYVPFIEVYSATDSEKAILRKFIEYNGMTAGYVGNIDMNGFVKANIIRYFGSYGSHELNELNNELMKGVYL